MILFASFLGVTFPPWTANTSRGDFLAYVGEADGAFDILDLNTGAATVLSDSGQVIWGLAFGPGNVIYGTIAPTFSSNATLVTVNPSTGTITSVGALGVAVSTFTNLADHTLYAVGFSDNNLYSVNPGTGAATLIGSTGLPVYSTSLGNSLASDGTHLFYTLQSPGSSTSTLYSLSMTTGVATLIGSTGVAGIFGSVFAGPTFQQGQLFGFLGNGDIDFINTTTGHATFFSHSGRTDIFGGVGIFTSVLVPEPSSFTLAIIPMGAVLLYRVGRRLAPPNRL